MNAGAIGEDCFRSSGDLTRWGSICPLVAFVLEACVSEDCSWVPLAPPASPLDIFGVWPLMRASDDVRCILMFGIVDIGEGRVVLSLFEGQ